MPLYNPTSSGNSNFPKLTYISNDWYEAGAEFGNGAASSAAIPNGRIILYPAFFYGPGTIIALGGRVNTTQAGGNFQVAVYANNPTTNRPTGTALVSSASMLTTTAGVINATTQTGGGSIGLTISAPQILWFAANSDNGTSTWSGTTSFLAAGVMGTPTQSNLSGGSNRLNNVSVTGVTFGTWSDLTSATFVENLAAAGSSPAPAVHFKIQ